MYITLTTLLLTQSPSVQLAEILDLDGDGIVYPMEAADAIQMFYEEGEGMPVADVDELIIENNLYLEEEAEYFIEDFDVNGDGIIQMAEVPIDLAPLAKFADLNNDGEITVEEIMKVNPDSEEVFAMVEIEEIYSYLDENQDGIIELEVFVEDDEEFAELVIPFDINKDNAISRKEMIAGFAQLDAPVTFEVVGEKAMMRGTIGVSTPFRVMELVFYHPEVKVIVMTDVPGSIDDDSSLRASRMVRAHGLNTHVPSDGEVASGGTDFFQAGVRRTCGNGAKFGVHSWAEFAAEGTDYPRDSEVHEMYLEYCDEMGIPQSFYWYTLEAAPAADIHWMTADELIQYNMLTVPIKE